MKKILMLVMLIGSLKGEVVMMSETIDECNGYLQKADRYMEKSIEKADKNSAIGTTGMTATEIAWIIANTYANMSRLMQERYRICIVKFYKKE